MGRTHDTSLNPTLLTRVRQALQPDWVHTLAARRAVAGVLVVLAALSAIRADPGGEHDTIVVASHDIAPGTALGPDDVHVEKRLTSTLPDGAQAGTDAVIGATTAGPVRRGEVITDVRLLSSRLAEADAGPQARIVPVPIADQAVLDVLRSGDVIDILAAPSGSSDAEPRVIARDGVVVLVSDRPKGGAGDRVVLVALPPAPANSVAGATLTQSMALTLH